jgi:putative phosphoesterase
MRYLVVSDTHGNLNDLRNAVGRYGPIDGLVHLGDGVLDGLAVAQEFGIPFHGVRGNTDFNSDFPDTDTADLDGRTFLLLHGFQLEMNPYHPPSVQRETIAELAAMARKKKARGVFFGHTHQALLDLAGGVLVMNPGDQYRGASVPPTFALLETRNGETRISLYRKGAPDRWQIFSEAYVKEHAPDPFYP